MTQIPQTSDDLSQDVPDWPTAEEKHSFLLGTLLIIGIILVCFANGIGQMAVQHCDAAGNCGWSNENVDAAALTCRTVGVLFFAAGLVERLIFALTRAIRDIGD